VLRLVRHGRFPDPAVAAGLASAGVATTGAARPRGGRPRVYSAVVGARRTAAETLGWPCGKRLAPFLPEVVPALEAEGLVHLTDEEPAQLLDPVSVLSRANENVAESAGDLSHLRPWFGADGEGELTQVALGHLRGWG